MAWSDAARKASAEVRRRKASTPYYVGYVGGGGGMKLTKVIESREKFLARVLRHRKALRGQGKPGYLARNRSIREAVNEHYVRSGRKPQA